MCAILNTVCAYTIIVALHISSQMKNRCNKIILQCSVFEVGGWRFINQSKQLLSLLNCNCSIKNE